MNFLFTSTTNQFLQAHVSYIKVDVPSESLSPQTTTQVHVHKDDIPVLPVLRSGPCRIRLLDLSSMQAF